VVEVNVRFRVYTYQKRRNSNHVLSYANVTVLDQSTGHVVRLSHTVLKYLSLETTVQKLFNVQSEHVFQTLLGFSEETESIQTAEESSTFEDTDRVLYVECEQGTSYLTDLSKGQLYAPYFTLVLETGRKNSKREEYREKRE
jgi:hypothetical protein